MMTFFSIALTVHDLQWVSTISTVILMILRSTSIEKCFLVPLFALQAPQSIISWIKGDYGIWTAFLALLIRLFFSIHDELELPFTALLLVILAPYEIMSRREKLEGVTVSLLITGYLAFQHFSRIGSLKRSFDRDSIIATLTVTLNFAVSFLLLYIGFRK